MVSLIISTDMAHQFAIECYQNIIAEIKNEQEKQPKDLQEDQKTNTAT